MPALLNTFNLGAVYLLIIDYVMLVVLEGPSMSLIGYIYRKSWAEKGELSPFTTSPRSCMLLFHRKDLTDCMFLDRPGKGN